MIKIFNKIFSILKFIMVIATFALTMYVLLFMYERLEKEPLGKDFSEFIAVLLPYLILIILFVVNVVTKKKHVNNDIFYNITCVVVLGAISFMCYRTMMDQNMVLWGKYGYKINFNYFADQLIQIKTLLYGLSFINVILIVEGVLEKKSAINDITPEIKNPKIDVPVPLEAVIDNQVINSKVAVNEAQANVNAPAVDLEPLPIKTEVNKE